MFKELLILTRTLNLHYHHMHNTAFGPTFFSDHKALNKFYEDLDDAYDSLAERRIGLTGDFSRDMLIEVLNESAEIIANAPYGNMLESFMFAAQLESELYAEVARAMAGQTEGTKNLLAGLADDSEARQYFLRQRMK